MFVADVNFPSNMSVPQNNGGIGRYDQMATFYGSTINFVSYGSRLRN